LAKQDLFSAVEETQRVAYLKEIDSMVHRASKARPEETDK